MLDALDGFGWDAAMRVARIVVAIGVAQQALEALATRREFARGGLFSGTVQRSGADGLFAPGLYLTLVVVQLGCGLALLVVPSGHALASGCLAGALVVRLLANFRNRHGVIGADQMHVIVLAGLLAYEIAPDDWARQACGWFIALQSVLAYVTSGIAKALSPPWRGGTAVAGILRTRTWGDRLSSALVRRLPALSVAACWGTIAFECAAPLALLHPMASLAFVALGVGFHAGIAATMGLNDFLWPYLATYPALLRCALDVS